jgi:Xaa-Pro aminopeptidase
LSRRNQVKKWLREQGLDAFLVSKPEHRYYLSGFTGTNGYLLLTLEQDYLLTDFRYHDQARQETEGYQLLWGSNGWGQALNNLLWELGLKKLGIDRETVTLSLYEYLKMELTGIVLVPEKDPCRHLRKIKSPQEIALIKKAAEITDKAFMHIVELIRPGLTEKEVAWELEFFMRRLGGEGPSFDTIVASGPRAALPHGVASTKIMEPGDLVILDFGTIVHGYHSDFTRTLVLGEPQKKQSEIYNLVLEAQTAVLQAIQPGMLACEADALARKVITQASYGSYFGHSLGHGVGLEIHEGPNLSPRETTILEPGMVVTVEPGIYISGWGGIRIEDLIVITSRGCEKLSKAPDLFKVGR